MPKWVSAVFPALTHFGPGVTSDGAVLVFRAASSRQHWTTSANFGQKARLT
jgi:hypothetical protein